MRVAYVVPRYGLEVRGGAELGARMLAERLAVRPGWSVEVFTTTALEATTWANSYPAGTVDLAGVRVHRFDSIAGRHPDFDRLGGPTLARPHAASPADEQRWIDLQGPVCPDAVAAAAASDADVVVCYPYLYHPTVRGVPAARAAGKAVVQHPAAHDEPPLRLPLFRDVFAATHGFVFQTWGERRLVQRLFAIAQRRQIVMGLGVEPQPADPGRLPAAVGERPYLLCLGRVDDGKGTAVLARFFAAYKDRHPGPLALVFAGPVVHPVPAHPDVVVLGEVDEDAKWALLGGAQALVNPSGYEAFSIVVIEAWFAGTPVVVNAGCAATREHVERSGGGLWFGGFAEFEAVVDRLTADPALRSTMVHRGRGYAEANFRWPRIIDRYQAFLEGVAEHANAALDVREPEAAPVPSEPRRSVRPGWFDLGAMAALFVLGFVPRILWRAGVPTEWDSVQFVLGVTHFDVEQGRPHPPGYYLLIVSARVVRALTGLGPHGALLLIAATGSALTAAAGYLLGRALRGRWMGLALGLFLATSPFLSFYGAIANSYSVECFGATVLALIAVTARPGGRHHIWAALALAGVAGFRPSAFVLVAPLAVVAVLRTRRDWRGLAASAGVLVVASAAWAIPEILEQPGGLEPILRTNRDLWNQASERTSILHGAPADAWFKNIGIGSVHTFLAVAVLLLTALVAVVVAVAATGSRIQWRRPSGQVAILAVGVLPGFLVATFVHFGKQGYVLTFLPSLAAMILCLVDWDRRTVAATALAVVAVTGVYELHVFASNDGLVGPWVVEHVPILGRRDLGAPYSMTRTTLKTVDRDARSYLALREVLDPNRDAIVCEGDEGAIRFRQLGYELPEFVIHMVNPGKDIIRMHDNTWAVENDSVLEVLPGGRAVFTFNAPPPEILALEQQGLATRIHLSTGPTAWAVPAGVTVFGVSIQENPNAAVT